MSCLFLCWRQVIAMFCSKSFMKWVKDLEGLIICGHSFCEGVGKSW